MMSTQSKRTALICGVSGQDGAYLAGLLLEKGYRVVGTSRDEQITQFRNLRALGILDQVETTSMAINDFRSVLQVLAKYRPAEVYNLAGQSSVGLSFDQPVETLESISMGTLNILEGLRFLDPQVRFYNASSSECFGDTGDSRANEDTPFRPRSPYAVAKAAAFWEVANYREAYGLFAASGILFNHESPLRAERFVTQKIVRAACRIANGSDERLQLGDTSIRRDWGWAPEYVDAMWRILQEETPRDYVIATGETNALSDFVEEAFHCAGLTAREHVDSNPSIRRPTELAASLADTRLAEKNLGWRAQTLMKTVAQRMVEAEFRRIASVTATP